jgi:hypothetical protein
MITNLLFYAVISIAVGMGYYLLHPHLTEDVVVPFCWRSLVAYLNLYKVFIISVLCSLFFSESTNLLLFSIISIAVGVGYYLLNEMYPQFIVPFKIMWLIAKRQLSNRLSRLIHRVGPVPKGCHDSSSKIMKQANNMSVLSYYDVINDKCKKYIFLFSEKARSNDLIIFKDEFNNDITDFIEPYLGPLQNFHGSLLTPRDFNHKKIYVFRDGSINVSKTFEGDEPIVFT